MSELKVISEFENYIKVIQGRTPKTISGYISDIKLFIKFLEETKKSEVTIEDIKIISITNLHAYMGYLMNKGNQEKTRARRIIAIRSFYNYLLKMDIVSSNPVNKLELPKIPKRLPHHLQLKECDKLLNAIDGEYKERDYAIATLFLTCGLRLSELVNINIDDIKDDVLTVIGKGNKQRSIPLTDFCIKAIKEYLKVRIEPKEDKNALFTSKQHKRISEKMVQCLIKSYMKSAKVKNCSTHSLRHTAATLMYQNGAGLKEIQELLGHENISTTEIYTHLDNKQLKNAVNTNPLANR